MECGMGLPVLKMLAEEVRRFQILSNYIHAGLL